MTEDRQKFAEELAKISEPVAPSRAAYSVAEVPYPTFYPSKYHDSSLPQENFSNFQKIIIVLCCRCLVFKYSVTVVIVAMVTGG